jgi:DnaJ-class molecular chaperone
MAAELTDQPDPDAAEPRLSVHCPTCDGTGRALAVISGEEVVCPASSPGPCGVCGGTGLLAEET